MSVITPPSRPSIPSGEALKDPATAMKAQQEMADYNFAMQTLKSMQDNENSTRSNIAKSSDDALKNTIANLK